MNTEIFIVTFKRDVPYLRHCLRSINKFASGFSGVTIVVPKDPPLIHDDTFYFVDPYMSLRAGDEWPDNPMLWHEWVIMCADEWCPKADFIVHLDADCIFTAPVTPETYIENGKPILRWEDFHSVAQREPGVLKWREATDKCLPFRNLKETMRAMPLVYCRETYALARDAIRTKTGQPAEDYVRSCKGSFPQGFCEFVTLGNTAMHAHPKRYVMVEQHGDIAFPPTFVQQFWSHGAMDLKQTIWVDGSQQEVVPLNYINAILGSEDGGPSPVLTGLRELPDILTEIEHRDKLGEWLNKHKCTGAGAEIGVMHGGWSETILKEWKGQQYFMVDLWASQPSDVYRERTDNIDYEAKYRDCVAISARFPITEIIRKASVEAANDVPDGSLDWVFIDANHSYRAVLEDLDAWYPKLRQGGLLSGHDYGHDTNWPHWCEVKPAVDRWMNERNIPFLVTDCSSWWAIKP